MFVAILLFEGEGYPASYFYLERNAGDGDRKISIEKWYKSNKTLRLISMKNVGVEPTFIKMDKDIGQIGAAAAAWPNSTINLCLWNILRAMKRRLRDPKEVF